MAVGSPLAAVAVAVFANDHRWPNGALREIVVERHRRIVQERKQVAPMTAETLEKPRSASTSKTSGQPVLFFLAGCTENEMLRKWVSKQRIFLTKGERERLVALGKAIGPGVAKLITIVHLRTYQWWIQNRNAK